MTASYECDTSEQLRFEFKHGARNNISVFHFIMPEQ